MLAISTKFVQLVVADITVGVHAIGGGEKLPEGPRKHRNGPGHDPAALESRHRPISERATAWMNRLLRFEEAIDVAGHS